MWVKIIINILILSLILYFSYESYKFLSTTIKPIEGFAGAINQASQVTSQIQAVSSTLTGLSSAQRIPTVSQQLLPENQACLVNYYVLGVRTTGFLGPFDNGYFDADNAVKLAAEAGARLFVLDIDYIDSCTHKGKYFPRIVVRDVKNRNRIEDQTFAPVCQSQNTSNILQVAQAIKKYALGQLNQQSTDPVVIVLNFLRIPPGGKKAKEVLDYYSAVAQALSPLYPSMLHNEPSGNYSRQKLQGNLLTASLDTFIGKVIIATNTDLTGFRDPSVSGYDSSADLDYLTNLSLYYNQSQEGATAQANGQVFGILQKVGDFQIIPDDRKDTQMEQTQLQFTVLLPDDPSKSPTEDEYNTATGLGANCLPIAIWDTKDNLKYFFTNDRFYKSSWIPKPSGIRYTKPSPIVPAVPSPQLNANGGMLRAPQ